MKIQRNFMLFLCGFILLACNAVTGLTPTSPPAGNTAGLPATQVGTSTSGPTRVQAPARPNSVENENILLHFNLKLKAGLAITNICDEQANVDYISPNCAAAQPTSLFEFGVDGTGNSNSYPSDTGLSVTAFHTNPDGSLSISAAAKEVPLIFTIDVSAPAGEPAAIIHIKAKNTGQTPYYLRMVLPNVGGLQNISSPDMWGAIPQEVGSVAPLNDNQSFASNPKFGMQLVPNESLPHGINSMELAAIYNHKDGGGLFFASLDNPASGGVAPIEFTLDSSAIAGYWSVSVEAQQQVELPGLAIGVFPHGDWHTAVDYYVGKNQSNWSFPKVPAWFRDEGAIYSFSGGGAGGIFLNLPGRRGGISGIKSFEDLPTFLTEARALGSNIVYLFDY